MWTHRQTCCHRRADGVMWDEWPRVQVKDPKNSNAHRAVSFTAFLKI